ncbi:UNKNOWN [Stylonychia lemnae]|uniref:Importin N-terminal domain-containing protein n=1 Tax=Stylonychia lemnae TaxID=5949 RepID=A0A078B3T9_STYLE|nr:UNKNOWN [Stylonychia lemnae]|eukprot:CDW89210.1 UNKNOWN [Stylonychia lemnae]
MEPLNHLQAFFTSVDSAQFNSLVVALEECQVNSNKILEIEKSIKQSVQDNQYQQKVFLTLCSVYLLYDQNQSIQWLSSIILKNTLKDNILFLKEKNTEELKLIKQALIARLINDGANLFNNNVKLQEEFYKILSLIIVKEFNLDSNDTLLFQELISLYQAQYNIHSLKTVIQIFEEGDDDRFWKFIPSIMPATLVYLQNIRENKLLYLVWQMIQHVQWSVGVDQDALEKCLNIDTIKAILNQILQINFNHILLINGEVNVQIIQEKRYCSKILTLLFRDFMNTKKVKPEALKYIKDVYLISMKNLVYFLPFYLTTYTFNQDLDSIDEDYEIEFQGFVVQVISLISTLISLHHKVVLKDLKSVNEQLLVVMFSYCIKGTQTEKIFADDKNQFLIEFLDSEENYENQVSIRSSVCDFLEDACQHFEFDREILEKIIALFVQDSFNVTVEMSNLAFQKIKSINSITNIDPSQDTFLIPGYTVMKVDVGFFIIGSMQDSLNIPSQLIDQCIKYLNNPECQIILKLRSLWLLEKLSDSQVVRKLKDSIGRQVFQIISDQFVNSQDFVLNYQCIKTLYRYIKLIDIKSSYPENYQDMLSIFMQKHATIIPQCSDETIHTPLESLAFLSKIDTSSCLKVIQEVMPVIMDAYQKYYQDGIIGSDIVEIIKIWARLPNNDIFSKIFLPQVNQVITQYYQYTCTNINAIEAQKMLDSSILKNMLSILTSYIVQSKQRNFDQELVQILNYMFMMELEILNVSKDIYVCIYTILSLSSFAQAVPDLIKQYNPQINMVLKKILSYPGGLDESSLLYIGHFILILVQNGDIDNQTQQQILLILVQRLAKSMSFLIPIATSIIQYGNQSLNFLIKNSDINDVKSMIQNWISYSAHFQDSFSKEMSKRGLVQLLEYTKHDLDFAKIMVQTKLVQVIARDLIYSEQNNKKKSQVKGVDYEVVDDDEDDLSVDDDDSADGSAQMKQQKKEFQGADDDFEDLDDEFNDIGSAGNDLHSGVENQDEENLLSSYLEKFTQGPDIKVLTSQVIKSLGKETLIKIVNTVTDDGDSLFSKAEQDALLSL